MKKKCIDNVYWEYSNIFCILTGCPFCSNICGLEIAVEIGTISSVIWAGDVVGADFDCSCSGLFPCSNGDVELAFERRAESGWGDGPFSIGFSWEGGFGWFSIDFCRGEGVGWFAINFCRGEGVGWFSINFCRGRGEGDGCLSTFSCLGEGDGSFWGFFCEGRGDGSFWRVFCGGRGVSFRAGDRCLLADCCCTADSCLGGSVTFFSGVLLGDGCLFGKGEDEDFFC